MIVIMKHLYASGVVEQVGHLPYQYFQALLAIVNVYCDYAASFKLLSFKIIDITLTM